MQRLMILAAWLSLASSITLAQDKALTTGVDDWAWWRGPNHSGVVSNPAPAGVVGNQERDLESARAGPGHADPTVVGSRIFLATADEEHKVQSVLCYDRRPARNCGGRTCIRAVSTAAITRRTPALPARSPATASGSSPPSTTRAQIWVTALDLDGKQVWQMKVGEFRLALGLFGFARPLSRHGAGLDRSQGRRPAREPGPPHRQGALADRAAPAPTYASPIVLKVGGKDQLLIAGADLVNSYDPATGQALWSSKGTSIECVCTIISDGDRIIASGGLPGQGNRLPARRRPGRLAGGRSAISSLPRSSTRATSIAVLDNGIAVCWKADTGQEMWKERLGGSGFSASPILAGEHIYVPSEAGRTFVLRANPQKCEIVAENTLGKETYASPVICGGRIYLRVVEDKRQEMLYCIGQ